MKSNQLPFFPVSGLNENEVLIFLPHFTDAMEVAEFLRSITTVYTVSYIGEKKFFYIGTQLFHNINYLLIQPQVASYGIPEEKLLLQVMADMWLYFDRKD